MTVGPYPLLRASYVGGVQSLVEIQDAELCSLVDPLIAGLALIILQRQVYYHHMIQC